jgi:hypothetical protein
MDSENEKLDPEGFVPLFHDPDLPASFFLGKMLEGFQGMFRIWLTSDEGQDVLRESIEPYVQLVVDKMAERLRGEINEQVERQVQESDWTSYRTEIEGVVREELQGSTFRSAVESVVESTLDLDNVEMIARDAAADAALDAATEAIESATYTVEVSV